MISQAAFYGPVPALPLARPRSLAPASLAAGRATWRQLYKDRSSRKTYSQKEKRSSGSPTLLKIVSWSRFSGKTYFYAIHPRLGEALCAEFVAIVAVEGSQWFAGCLKQRHGRPRKSPSRAGADGAETGCGRACLHKVPHPDDHDLGEGKNGTYSLQLFVVVFDTTLLGIHSWVRFCRQEFGEFPRLVGRYYTVATYCPSRPGELPKFLLIKPHA